MSSIPDHACIKTVSSLFGPTRQRSSHSFMGQDARQIEKGIPPQSIHKISQLQPQSNQQTPIYKLPNELLETILLLAADTSAIYRYISLITLASVSSRWLATILYTPLFWNHLDSTSDFLFTKRAIRRSKQAPLYIMCPRENMEYLERTFIKMVAPHVSRWRTFQSFSPHTMEILSNTLFHSPATHLEVFEVLLFGTPNTSTEVPQTILNSAPRLHTLAIPSFSFPLDSNALWGLRSITFSPYTEGKHLTGDQWYRFLSLVAGLPKLETIKILGVSSIAGIEGYLQEVLVPGPKNIHLDRLSPAIIGALLSSIRVAPNQHYSINVTSPLYFPDGFNRMFPEFVSRPSLLSAIRSGTHLEVSLNNGTIWVFWKRDNVAFSLYMPRITTNVMMGIFTNLLSPRYMRDIKTVTLRGVNRLAHRSLCSQLCFFNNLERLEIYKKSRNDAGELILAELMDALSSPVPSDEDSGCVYLLCPKLKYLKVEVDNELESVWDFFNGRYLSTSKNPRMILPALLEELHLLTGYLTSADQHTIEYLKEQCDSKNISFRHEPMVGYRL